MDTLIKKSRLVLKLYTNFDLKCTWNPQLWYLNVCINQQIVAIVLEFGIAQFTHHEVQGGGKNPETEGRGFFAPTADRVVS